MLLPPLTHHDILGLVEPFARAGRHVDLAASNRIERRLAFKPVDLASEPATGLNLQEALQLEAREGGSFRLTRALTSGQGLQATLLAVGPQAGALLAQVDAIPPEHQFQGGPGYVIARSYTLGSPTAESPANQPPLILCRGEARVDGLTLTLHLPDMRGTPAEITLLATGGDTLALPEDLLAVLGWDWSRLVQKEIGWAGKLRLRGAAPRRSRHAERALEQAAQHLARVMTEPPRRFHQRCVWARWGVVFRRAIPSLTAIALIAVALLLPRLIGEERSGLMMALHYVPIAVLALSFKLQELPRFEIPPWPRPFNAAAWRVARGNQGDAR